MSIFSKLFFTDQQSDPNNPGPQTPTIGDPRPNDWRPMGPGGGPGDLNPKPGDPNTDPNANFAKFTILKYVF